MSSFSIFVGAYMLGCLCLAGFELKYSLKQSKTLCK